MTKEQVMIEMGVNRAEVKKNLDASEGDFKSWSHNIMHNMREIKHLMHGFGAIYVAEHIAHLAQEAGAWFGEMVEGGKKAIQQIEALGEAYGKVGEKLRESRKEHESYIKGRDKKASAAEYEDAEKIPGLQKRLNQDQIQNLKNELRGLDEGEGSIPEARHRLKYATREGQQGDMKHWSGILAERIKKRDELEGEMEDIKEREVKRARKELEDKQQQSEKLKHEFEKLDDLYTAQVRSEEEISKIQKQYKDKQLSEYRPSLKDIANSNSYYALDAQDLMRAQDSAKRDLLNFGDDPETERKIKYAESLKEPLRKAGLISPEETLAEASKASEQHLADIRKKMDRAVEELTGQ